MTPPCARRRPPRPHPPDSGVAARDCIPLRLSVVDGESTLYGLTIGDMVAGKYEVLRLLGEGGMGAVYEVRHAHTRRHFALKWMTPQLASSAA